METLSANDLYVLARAFAKMPTDGLECSTAIRLMLDHIDFDTDDGYDLARKMFAGHAAEIFAIDPKAPPPQSRPVKSEPVVHVPGLPDYARLSAEAQAAAESAGAWLTWYTDWAGKSSPMTPKLFHEAGGLVLIATAIARRVYIDIGGRIYPHLFILWIAMTTRYAKSTGLRCVLDVAWAVFPHLLLPQQATPEALLSSQAGMKPENIDSLPESDRKRIEAGLRFAGQRSLVKDEFSGIFGATRKDYMQGFSEYLMEVYDAGPPIERMTKKGLQIVHRPAMSILGAMTPTGLARNVNDDGWENGQMARYVLLCPTGPEPFTHERGPSEPPPQVVEVVRQLYERLPEPPDEYHADQQETLSASIESAAMKAYQQYHLALWNMANDELDVRLLGNYGRLSTTALKVALNLAVVDWVQQADGNRPVIRLGHWARAQQIVETWRESLHRLLPMIDETADSRGQKRILTQLRHSPTGLSKSALLASTRMKAVDLDRTLNMLLESGEIQVEEYTPQNGGHRARVYRIG